MEKVLDLKNWLASRGCMVSKKIDYPGIFDNGLCGVIVKEKVEPGEVLISVKWDSTFSTELLLVTPIIEVFNENPSFFGSECPESLDNRFLALVLFEKLKGNDSKWDLFFNTMPENPENLCDWSETELAALQDPDIVYDSRTRKGKNFKSYEELREILVKYPQFFSEIIDVQLIEWCWKIIWTRSFMRSPEHSALVPFADFINHGPSETGFYFVDQKEEFDLEIEEVLDCDEMYTDENILKLTYKDLYEINFSAYETIGDEDFDLAKRIFREAFALDDLNSRQSGKKDFDDIRGSDFVIVSGQNDNYLPGSQLLIEYGNYSNTSLLMHYGFTIPHNRHEIFRLKLTLSEILNLSQCKHLPDKFPSTGKILFPLGTKGLCREFLRTLRAFLWTPLHKPTAFFSQSDLDLELKVLEMYEKILQQKLNLFPTSLVQDLEIKNYESVRENFAVI